MQIKNPNIPTANYITAFSVTLSKILATSLILSVPVPNTAYRLASGAVLLNTPIYTTEPPNASVFYTYSLQSEPASTFISVTLTTPIKIKVLTDNNAHYGSYQVMVKTTETESGLINYNTFTLKVYCIQTFTPVLIPDQTYYEGDKAIDLEIIFSINPSFCVDELVHLVTLADDTALPTPIVFNAPKSISIDENA